MKIYLLTTSLIILFFASCTTTKIVKLSAIQTSHVNIEYDKGVQYITQSQRDVECKIAYHSTQKGYLVMDVEIKNNSEYPIEVDPKDFYYDMPDSLGNKKIITLDKLKTRYANAIDPEWRIPSIQKEKVNEEIRRKRNNIILGVLAVAVVVTTVAVLANEAKKEKSNNQNNNNSNSSGNSNNNQSSFFSSNNNRFNSPRYITPIPAPAILIQAPLITHNVDNNGNVQNYTINHNLYASFADDNLEIQKTAWENLAMCRTTLQPNQVMRGMVIFPLQNTSSRLRFCIPVSYRKFDAWFWQNIQIIEY